REPRRRGWLYPRLFRGGRLALRPEQPGRGGPHLPQEPAQRAGAGRAGGLRRAACADRGLPEKGADRPRGRAHRARPALEVRRAEEGAQRPGALLRRELLPRRDALAIASSTAHTAAVSCFANPCAIAAV